MCVIHVIPLQPQRDKVGMRAYMIFDYDISVHVCSIAREALSLIKLVYWLFHLIAVIGLCYRVCGEGLTF